MHLGFYDNAMIGHPVEGFVLDFWGLGGIGLG